MAAGDEKPEIRAIIGSDPEYRFATGAHASKPQKMVYLDFFQLDPQSDPKVARTTARIVMLPTVAKDVIERLSAALQDPADDPEPET